MSQRKTNNVIQHRLLHYSCEPFRTSFRISRLLLFRKGRIEVLCKRQPHEAGDGRQQHHEKPYRQGHNGQNDGAVSHVDTFRRCHNYALSNSTLGRFPAGPMVEPCRTGVRIQSLGATNPGSRAGSLPRRGPSARAGTATPIRTAGSGSGRCSTCTG